MSTSKFFNHTEHLGEIGLFDQLVQESIQISGFDVRYIMRTNDVDSILFEAKNSNFSEEDSWDIEANIPDSLKGWQGEGLMMNHFGINIDYGGSVTLSKTRWEEIMRYREQHGFNTRERPLEGDLIYFGYGREKFNHTLFQITHVDFSDASWQAGRTFVYRLRCTLYKPNTDDTVDIEIGDVGSELDKLLSNTNAISQHTAFNNKVNTIATNEKNVFGEY